MKQIILTLAAVSLSLSAASGQETEVFDRYYIDGLIYEKTSETTVSCDGTFDNGVKKVVIPETINADGSVYTVTGISDDAFAYSNLHSVTIPISVTYIGSGAFSGCILESVNISDLSAWCRIYFFHEDSNPLRFGGNLYLDGELITDLTIPDDITEIKSYAFYSYDELASVTIPNSVTRIRASAFMFCDGLASVSIGNSVTSIEYYAFNFCEGIESVNISDLSAWCKIDFTGEYSNPLRFGGNLYLDGELITDLTIPDDITEIKSYAFYGCDELASVTIPNSVTSIGTSAFEYCSGLKTLVIGRNVSSISNYAFYENNLKRIAVLAPVPPPVDFIFSDDCYAEAELNVPIGSLEAYKSAGGWKKFKNIQEKDFGSVNGVKDDAVSVTTNGGSIEIGGAGNAPVEVYNLSGQLVYSGTETTVGGLNRGIYIVRVNGQAFKVAL